MASLAGRTEATDHMHAICQCDVRRLRDYNFDQSAKSPLPVRAACEEQPQAPPIDSISSTSFWLHLLPPFPFSLFHLLPFTLTSIHSFPTVPSISSFSPPFLLSLLLFFTKIITLEGTSINGTYSLFSFISHVLSSAPSRNQPGRCYFRLHSC